MEQEEKKWCVYCHTNKINGKKYIGITSRKPERRWGTNGNQYSKNNQKVFYNAIQKYKWENFEHVILFENLTREEVFTKEIELIKKYKTTTPRFGYNISNGGSAPMYGRKHSNETLEKYSKNRTGSNNSFYGKHHTDESKAKRGRKVICLNNGKIYNTISSTGFKHVEACLNGREFSAGKDEFGSPLYWAEYFDGIDIEYELKKIKDESVKFHIDKRLKTMKSEDKVICLDTKIIYDNIYACSDILNINVSDIKSVCFHSGCRKTLMGLTFMFYSEYTKYTEYEIKKILYRSKTKNINDVIVCLNTNDWFINAKDAIKITKLKCSDTILENAKLEAKYGGRHIKTNERLVWRFLKDFEKMDESEIRDIIDDVKERRVLCKDDGKIFNTLSEASNFYGIIPTSISACCRGIYKTCGNGMVFEFIK